MFSLTARRKLAMIETKAADGNEKHVFIYVFKIFVFLYDKGFENVIRLRYS